MTDLRPSYLFTLFTAMILAVPGGVLPAEGAEREVILQARLERGDLLPGFSLRKHSDPNVRVSAENLKGKTSVLLFFALDNDMRKKKSKEMLSRAAALQKKYPNARFLGVMSDQGGAAAYKTLAAESGLDIEILNDDERKAYEDFGVFMMPLAMVFSPERKLLERIPLNDAFERTLEAWIRVGNGEITAEKAQEAIAPPRHAEKTPQQKEYDKLLNLARVMSKRRMYPKSVEHYAQAAAILPAETLPRREAGYVLLRMKDYVAAEAMFNEILKSAPQDAEAAAGLGLALHGQGKDADALPELQDAAATLRPLPEVLVALAEIHAAAGRKEEALATYRRAVERFATDLERCATQPDEAR